MKKIEVSTQEVKVLEKIITALDNADPIVLKHIIKIDLSDLEKVHISGFTKKLFEKNEKHLVICPSRYYADKFLSEDIQRMEKSQSIKIESIRTQKRCIVYIDSEKSQTQVLNIKKEFKTVDELSRVDGAIYDRIVIQFGDYRIQSKKDMELLEKAFRIKQGLDIRVDNNIYEDSLPISFYTPK